MTRQIVTVHFNGYTFTNEDVLSFLRLRPGYEMGQYWYSYLDYSSKSAEFEFNTHSSEQFIPGIYKTEDLKDYNNYFGVVESDLSVDQVLEKEECPIYIPVEWDFKPDTEIRLDPKFENFLKDRLKETREHSKISKQTITVHFCNDIFTMDDVRAFLKTRPQTETADFWWSNLNKIKEDVEFTFDARTLHQFVPGLSKSYETKDCFGVIQREVILDEMLRNNTPLFIPILYRQGYTPEIKLDPRFEMFLKNRSEIKESKTAPKSENDLVLWKGKLCRLVLVERDEDVTEDLICIKEVKTGVNVLTSLKHCITLEQEVIDQILNLKGF